LAGALLARTRPCASSSDRERPRRQASLQAGKQRVRCGGIGRCPSQCAQFGQRSRGVLDQLQGLRDLVLGRQRVAARSRQRGLQFQLPVEVGGIARRAQGGCHEEHQQEQREAAIRTAADSAPAEGGDVGRPGGQLRTADHVQLVLHGGLRRRPSRLMSRTNCSIRATRLSSPGATA
jgi:hypothetical protein